MTFAGSTGDVVGPSPWRVDHVHTRINFRPPDKFHRAFPPRESCHPPGPLPLQTHTKFPEHNIVFLMSRINIFQRKLMQSTQKNERNPKRTPKNTKKQKKTPKPNNNIKTKSNIKKRPPEGGSDAPIFLLQPINHKQY